LRPIDWNPLSYEYAARHLALVRRLSSAYPEALALLRLIQIAINASSERGDEPCLSCPAPATDPDGHYRVALWHETPVIERLTEQGEWMRVAREQPTQAPPPLPSQSGTFKKPEAEVDVEIHCPHGTGSEAK